MYKNKCDAREESFLVAVVVSWIEAMWDPDLVIWKGDSINCHQVICDVIAGAWGKKF